MSIGTRTDCSPKIELDLSMCFADNGCTQFPTVISSHAFYLNTLAPNRPGNLSQGESFAVKAGFFFSEDNDPDNNWSLCSNRAGAGCDQTGDPLIVTRTDNGLPGDLRRYEMTTQVPYGTGQCLQVDGSMQACEGACLTIGDFDQGCYDVPFKITWQELP